MTYLGERKLGNFRDRTLKQHRNSETYKQRPGMSPDHLVSIRNLPCCLCGALGVEAHHLRDTGERGMGLKSTDKWALPLCKHCHHETHRVGTKEELRWFEERGISSKLLAMDLWFNRGDVPRMCRVVQAHRAEGKRGSRP